MDNTTYNKVSYEEQLKNLIEQNYNLCHVKMNDAPRGFAADTYYVDSDNSSLFLKIMRRPNRQALFINGLRGMDALTANGIDFVPGVVRTKTGELFIKFDNSVLTLLSRIDGKQTYSFDRRDAFEKLAKIYKVSAEFPDKDSYFKETFHDWFISAYEDAVFPFLKAEPTKANMTDEAVSAHTMLLPYADSLYSLVPDAKQAVTKCREQNAPFYLTHSDFPGNVMVTDSGRQYLIDFDESMFGPLERDGFMSIIRPEERDIWLDVMHRAFPQYIINEYFVSYYVLQRFMVDLIDFVKDLQNNADIGYRQRVLNSLEFYLMGQMYPAVLKYRAD